MVLVTVGNAHQPFTRLLSGVERLAQSGVISDVLMQSGHAEFVSTACRQVKFLPADEFERELSRANLVISHGGCTQLQVIKLGKKPVVMPRRRKFGEHVNDHQVELVEALAREGYVIPVYSESELMPAIAKAIAASAEALPPPAPIMRLVGEAIERLTSRRS